MAQFPYGKGHIAFSETRLFLEHILEHFIPGKRKLRSVYLRIRNWTSLKRQEIPFSGP